MEQTTKIYKTCSTCKISKLTNEFSKRKTSKDGLNNQCKNCVKKYQKEYYKDENNRKKHYKNNKEKILESHKKYYEKNKKTIREYYNEYQKDRRKSNINYKLSCNLRSRLYHVLKDSDKCDSTFKLLGCTIEEFKIHLENQFTEGMTWDNHGFYGWHIDHIRPCASFDLSNEEEQKICFHYTNLQPLWRKDNLIKSDKY